jgi:SAM-dependent methyltransferase
MDSVRDDWWNDRAVAIEPAMFAILDRWGGSQDAFFAQGVAHWYDMLYALGKKDIFIPADAAGCEIGCGVGRMTIPMARSFRRLYATDVSPNMIALAPQIDNVVYRATDTLADIPKVDFVLSHLVLQHLPKSLFWKYLNEAHDILVQGGILITQLHETEVPVEHDDASILVRGYTKDELQAGIDDTKWDTISLLEPGGISEVWKFLILRKK